MFAQKFIFICIRFEEQRKDAYLCVLQKHFREGRQYNTVVSQTFPFARGDEKKQRMSLVSSAS